MKRLGHINRIDTGRWRLRMSIGGKQETIGYYDTEAEAEQARDDAMLVRKDIDADYEGLTLGEFGRKVLTRREVGAKVRDPDSDWSRWNTHVRATQLARMALKRIRSKHCKRWLRDVEGKGIADQTIRNVRNVLSVVFAEAVEQELIDASPLREVRVKSSKRRTDDAWTYASPVEQGDLMAACETDVAKHLVAVALGSGLRAGELISLRLADVVLDEQPRLIVRFGGAPDLPTKNGKPRAVPLYGVALAAVRSWLELVPQYAPRNPHGLLFPRVRGGFRSEEHVITWIEWKGILERARITRRFRWHDLRHTCASSLVSGWWGRRWSLQEAKEMLGHSSIQVTQKYAHLAESAIHGAAILTTGVSAHVSGFGPKQLVAAPPAELESAANRLGSECSIQLSYGGLNGSESNELGKRCFSHLRAGKPPPDTALTFPEIPDVISMAMVARRALAAIHGDVGGRVFARAP